MHSIRKEAHLCILHTGDVGKKLRDLRCTRDFESQVLEIAVRENQPAGECRQDYRTWYGCTLFAVEGLHMSGLRYAASGRAGNFRVGFCERVDPTSPKSCATANITQSQNS